MQDRLSHTKEQQGNPVTRREEHGEPSKEAVFRLGMVGPEFDIAPAAKCH